MRDPFSVQQRAAAYPVTAFGALGWPIHGSMQKNGWSGMVK
ncbi:MAG: hypothetical protein NTV22_15755 [bacterium]|nr:hypothetical protein [bacterium]